MSKIDLKKELKEFYNASNKTMSFVDVPEMNFLMADGMGDPTKSDEFSDTIKTLFPVAYRIKFMIKNKNPEKDYTVMPLEGLWWADDMSDFVKGNRDRWKFTLMIMQPDFVTKNIFEDALEEVRKKKNPKALDKLRFERFKEGPSCQLLHIGLYSEEGPNIEKIHKGITDKGYEFDGHIQKHHEIYLSDFRKTAPEKLKTIIRQPYKKN